MWSLSPHPNSSTPLGSSYSTRHAPLGSAPAPTCGACHSTPIHLHRAWGLAPVPVMHPWVRTSTHVWSLSPHPNSSTPLGSSSGTRHAPLGSAPAPTCGACHSTPISLHPWGLVPVPLGSAPAPKYRACHSTPMHSHPWSLALAPLGFSSSTSHAAVGLAPAPFRDWGITLAPSFIW